MIIRTHGVPPETYEQARAQGLNVVDATCPLVTLVQNKAKQLVQEGYHLVIFGNPQHPEVMGTIGHAGGKATVIERPEDVAKVSLPKRVGVVVQTTQEIELLASFLAAAGAALQGAQDLQYDLQSHHRAPGSGARACARGRGRDRGRRQEQLQYPTPGGGVS